MASEKGSRKDKNQNIQVFVRLRPLNQRERDIKSLGVVEVHNNREVVVRQSQQTSHTKKFTFDRAFAPSASQVEVYQDVVSPLIEEVLAGYNCTVFAYGQTGTGKTHTMVGEASGDETNWQNDPMAGIIPRALSQLFDELRISNTEYTVRVSYLELYNEELFDLLSSSEDNSKLRIYEDVTRKGSNIVNGLEEVTVYNKNEVYKIMAQGQERKRVASTLMNAQSSRSHTVFTIVVHMKENSPEGEEFVKIGKLNLVDLAGSENISKAGSDNPGKRERARECVNINQSLLTLGRVITALVERHPHIPYRESKLTRILQESLGGRTKTSIIATISPGHKDLEETMSTLDYAHRAKNIQNKPEINQKMTKKAILKEYAEEIDKLKRDLQAARDKNGVYLANETYAEMTLKDEEQRKEIQALLLKKRAMEEERDKLEGVFREITSALDKQQSELSDAKSKLHCTKSKLVETTQMLNRARVECSEQKHLVSAHVSTESTLGAQARSLLQAADVAATHAAALHDTVDRRRNVEFKNLEVTRSYRAQALSCRRHVADSAAALLHSLHTTLQQLQHDRETVNSSNTQTLQQNTETLEQFIKILADSRDEMLSLTASTQSSLSSALARHRGKLVTCLHTRHTQLATCLAALVARLRELQVHAQREDFRDVHRYLTEWLSTTVSHVGSLRHAAAAFSARLRAAHAERQVAAAALAGKRKERAEKRKQYLSVAAAEIEQERAAIERQLTAQLEEIEREREETRERLQRYVDSEMQALELRLSRKLEEIEQNRQSLSARISRQKSIQESLLSAEDEEISLAECQLREAEGRGELELQGVREFDEEFHGGASTVLCDAETISQQVGEVVHKSYTQLLDIITADCDTVQNECRTMTEADEAVCKQLTTDTEAIDSELLEEHRTLNQNIIETLQSNNSQATTLVSTITASFATVSESSSSQCASQAATVGELFATLAAFDTELKGTVANLEEIEAKCLTEEYRVYSPTGATPRRTEYRFPRTLAATSPHHAILARYRARSDYTNEDCIVVSDSPSDTETESTLSEESGVFAAPPTPKVNGHTNGIMKSTSESDIYLIKQNQDMGKENINRSISLKKPSKLPAPASLKKPLYERNGAVN